MLFSSLEFLFLFFPAVIGINFILPKSLRNYWLLVASLFFYAWGEPKFVLIMIASICFNWLMALIISMLRIDDENNKKSKQASLRKGLLVFCVVANLSILFVYKYMNFTTTTLSKLFPSLNINITQILLPIGISFFTFQALSYVVDVYRGVPVQKNIAYVGLYISLFPQLIAGPIVRYTTVAEEIESRTVTPQSFSEGMLRFLRGFNKKMLLANIMAIVADFAFAQDSLSVVMSWTGAVAYTLQIFFDFGGYSEMAIGLGLMLGFNFPENFNYPYISKTITEFWRRWHISLGSWFRDYVYFPLGGSRVKTKKRLVFNLFVVWLTTGVWHGASWNFILWGVLYGVIITIEKIYSIPKKVDTNRSMAVAYRMFTLLMVILGWVLFRAVDLTSALNYIKSMFGLAGNAFIDGTAVFYIREYIVYFMAGILCSAPVFKRIREICSKTEFGKCICISVSYILQAALFVAGVSFLVMNAHNPFIYFNF